MMCMWGSGYTVSLPPNFSSGSRQAKPLSPFMFIEHEPQTPSRQERRKASVGSISFLILMSARSEEHTSELQSRENLVCRLLLEKKKIITISDQIDMRTKSKEHT